MFKAGQALFEILQSYFKKGAVGQRNRDQESIGRK